MNPDEKFFHKYIKNCINEHNFYEAHKHLEGLISFVLLSVQDMEIAIQYGIDPRYDEDMLFAECSPTNIELIKYLLNCGCDINAHDSKALYNSIHYDKIETAKFLLENGINVTNDIIMEACNVGQQYIKLLIDYGVDPERVMKIYLTKMSKETTLSLKYFDSIGLDVMAMI